MPAASRSPRAEGKRDAILAASITLFGRYGYRRTSMEEIAREAGIAKGTVYLYFPTKEVLFRALSQQTLDRALADAGRAATAPGGLAERLYGVLEAKYGYFHGVVHSSPHAGELIDSKNRLSADVFARGDRAYLRLVARMLASADRSGEIDLVRLGASADALAALLADAAHGIASGSERPPTAAALRRGLRTLVQLTVGALAPARGRAPDAP
jgi:AcrR family transcriptional regulator